jgi:subtilisin-like proprotein convertase family protein
MHPPILKRAGVLVGALALLLALLPAHSFAQGRLEYSIRDQGKTRTFEIAPDELLLSRWGSKPGELADEVRTKVDGAKVITSFGAKVLVQLPKAVDQRTPARSAARAVQPVAGSDAQPVLYIKGVVRNALSRRFASNQVLVRIPADQTVAQLVTKAGATGTRRTEAEGHAILTFANGWQALEAAANLREAGVDANAMLQRVAERMAAPNDPFFSNQWHLRNTGQGGGTLGIDANVVNAWDVTRGNGVTIVVVDDSLQTNHPDLAPNTPAFDSGLHFDFRDGDIDPRPADSEDRHGTAVAGVAAARQNNNIGTSGSAPEARLLGVRIIGSPVSDQDIADGLRWEPGTEVASVSNNSWGYTGAPALRGIDFVIKDALRRAATEGRGGLGQVTLFANGNSAQSEDDGNYSGIANSRYVAAIGALTNFGDQAFYSNPGANLLVSAPSNGGSLGIFTTDVTGSGGYNPAFPGEPADRNYTNSFGGTSSATPLTSGGAALILGANPNLGWRDVHEILAQTARKNDIADADWADNFAGFHFNHKYGAGMIDLTAAVVRALDWNILSAETSVTRSLAAPLVPASIPDRGTMTRPFDFTTSPNLRIERIEVVAQITHGHRSDLEITLVSPSGKQSVLAQRHSRPGPFSFDDDIDYDENGAGWTFTTTHHWGENSQGVWTLQVRDLVNGTAGTLELARVNIYGTPSSTQRFLFRDGAAQSPKPSQRQSVLENVGTAILHVDRIGDATGEASVDIASTSATLGGAAIAGVDFTPVAQTLVFQDGETSKEVPVLITDNTTQDNNRFVYFTLKNPVGASLGGASLTRLDIVDDESNLITVVPGDRDVSERSGSPNAGTFIISRSKATTDPVTVLFTVSGTAEQGVDYASVPSSVTIGPNETSATVTISPIDDDLIEGSESVLLTLDADPGYGIGVPGAAQLNLLDDDLPLVEIRAPDNEATEAGPTTGTFRVTRKHPRTAQPLILPSPLTVNFEIGGSAQPGQNYVPIEDRAVIPENSDHVDIIITPIDDAEYHANQSVLLKVAPSADYAIGFFPEDQVSIKENDPIPDPFRPTVTITAPADNASIPSPATTLLLTGTAADNQQVARVTYQVNGGPIRLATGTTQWNADIIADIVPGINVIEVRSFDQFDNPSVVATRTITYVVPRQLTVTVGPGGSVTTGFPGVTTRNVGIKYTITATPSSKSFVFAGWSGDFSETSREFTFVMPDKDATLVASFVPNPFQTTVTGKYQGLVHASPFSYESAGFIQINVTSSGLFTGNLLMGGVKYVLKGEFTGDQPAPGQARFRGTLPRPGSNIPLEVDLVLDLSAAGTQQITGSVAAADTSFNAAVLADKQVFNKRSNPYAAASPKPQLFTIMIPPIENPSNVQPHGLGWATLKIDAGGVVKMKGVLPDGSKATLSTLLTKNKTWPLFLALYKNRGVLLGNVQLDDQQPDSDLHATLDWFKPPIQTDKLFATGFSATDLDLLGSLYTAPAHGQPVLSGFSSAGTIAFREGYLSSGGNNREFDADFLLAPTNKVTINDRNGIFLEKVRMTVKTATGQFKGSFVHPQTNKATPFAGIVFQRKQPGGAGQFVGEIVTGGSFQTGSIVITPPVPQP